MPRHKGRPEFGHSISALQRRSMFLARVTERPDLRRRAPELGYSCLLFGRRRDRGVRQTSKSIRSGRVVYPRSSFYDCTQLRAMAKLKATPTGLWLSDDHIDRGLNRGKNITKKIETMVSTGTAQASFVTFLECYVRGPVMPGFRRVIVQFPSS